MQWQFWCSENDHKTNIFFFFYFRDQKFAKWFAAFQQFSIKFSLFYLSILTLLALFWRLCLVGCVKRQNNWNLSWMLFTEKSFEEIKKSSRWAYCGENKVTIKRERPGNHGKEDTRINKELKNPNSRRRLSVSIT